VHLIEVDNIDAESLKACMTFVPDAPGFQAGYFLLFFVPQYAAFCRYERFFARLLKGLFDKLFGMAQSVRRGGVYPVNARLKSRQNRADRLIVVLRTPAVLSRPAHRPGTQANGCQLQIRIS